MVTYKLSNEVIVASRDRAKSNTTILSSELEASLYQYLCRQEAREYLVDALILVQAMYLYLPIRVAYMEALSLVDASSRQLLNTAL
jgi:hypothetical protein